MPIPAGIIIAWPGTAASIPSGWSRCDGGGGRPNLNGKYLRGAASAGGTGGATQHNDHSVSHSHNTAHGHSASTSSDAPGYVLGGPGATWTHPQTHSHSGSLGTSDQGTSGTSASVGNADNDPPYWDVIWIVSDGTPTEIPETAAAWWDDDETPADWTQPANGQSRFLRGAAADGGATGGAATHTHTASHSHSIPSHSHTGTTNGSGQSGDRAKDSAPPTAAANESDHYHDLTSGGATGTTSSSGQGLGADGVLPAYSTLGVIQAGAGAGLPAGLIAAWAGAAGSIPDGWHICDGTDSTPDLDGGVFARGAASGYSDLGATGGGGAHTHALGSHTHSIGSHTHTVTVGTSTGWLVTSTGGDPSYQIQLTHSHSSGSSSASGSSTGSGSATSGTATATPPYYDVIFIQYQPVQGLSEDVNIFDQRVRIYGDAGGLAFERLDYRGGSWSTPITPFGSSSDPDIKCLPDGRLRAAYLNSDGDLTHAESCDDGETWTVL